MSLEVLSLIVTFIAALAALMAIPSIHDYVVPRLPDRLHAIFNGVRKLLILSAILSPAILFLWFYLFYPCPWYEINHLRSEVSRLNSLQQYSSTQEVGEKLCDCGDLAFGWNVQGNAEYDSGQYYTAANFYKRAIKADPENADGKRRNLASALIYTGDYKQAVDLLREIQTRNSSEAIRYGLGRALVFAGEFEEASTLLKGLNVVDGGSKGQSSVFYAFALLGLSRTEADADKRANLISDASKNICFAVNVERSWKDWLFNENSSVGNLQAVRHLLDALPSRSC